MKQCSKCGEAKPVSEFNKNSSRPDGFAHWCRKCANKANSDSKKANRAKATQYNREWRAANPDKVAQQCERHKEYQKQYYEANKETVLAKIRAYQADNKEQITAYKNEWSRTNGSGHRARAKRFGVIYTPINKTAIFERDEWICGLCGDPVDRTLVWPNPLCPTLDHIIPLSRGGDHVESNVQLAHFCCNLLKRDNEQACAIASLHR